MLALFVGATFVLRHYFKQGPHHGQNLYRHTHHTRLRKNTLTPSNVQYHHPSPGNPVLLRISLLSRDLLFG